MTRYRYITNGCALGSDSICRFRLIASNSINPEFSGSIVLRVVIPTDLKLEKYNCDSYSTTDDKRTLDALGYDILSWNASKGKWIKHNEFKGTMPCNIKSPY